MATELENYFSQVNKRREESGEAAAEAARAAENPWQNYLKSQQDLSAAKVQAEALAAKLEQSDPEGEMAEEMELIQTDLTALETRLSQVEGAQTVRGPLHDTMAADLKTLTEKIADNKAEVDKLTSLMTANPENRVKAINELTDNQVDQSQEFDGRVQAEILKALDVVLPDWKQKLLGEQSGDDQAAGKKAMELLPEFIGASGFEYQVMTLKQGKFELPRINELSPEQRETMRQAVAQILDEAMNEAERLGEIKVKQEAVDYTSPFMDRISNKKSGLSADARGKLDQNLHSMLYSFGAGALERIKQLEAMEKK
ncbi:TPA: hypothetical protein DF272_05500 [Candidatus Falkowbacteria bacterium]|nr:hypothetical protein [Candidatus Falkowbacteria bacterium]